jgi:hypothetical protein
MGPNTDTDDAPLPDSGAGEPALHQETAPDLRLRVVTHTDEPDQGTVHPPDATGIDRMETWITADLSAFVDRTDWR